MTEDNNIDTTLALTLAGRGAAWPTALSSDCDVEQAKARIDYHGVAPLLSRQPLLSYHWPEAMIEYVRRESVGQLFWEDTHRAAVMHALSQLHADGVDAVLMKGTALAYLYYPEPSLRSRGDTDLLVRPEALEKARSSLQEAGFRRVPPKHGLLSQEVWVTREETAIPQAIDLHWAAIDSPCLQGVIPTDDLFATARPISALGEGARAPDTVTLILRSLLNQAWHAAYGIYVDGKPQAEGKRLVWAMDNHLLFAALSEDEWRRLADLALARGIGPILLQAMREEAMFFATPRDQKAAAILESGSASTTVTRYFAASSRPQRVFSDIVATSGLASKLRFVWNEAVPSEAHLRGLYPDAERWPAWLLGLRRFSSRIARMAKRRPD